jgi:regulator of sigma E protease
VLHGVLAGLQTTLLYTVPFLMVLMVVVTVHELGHFLMAKAFGVAIERFSIGFGRALASWTDRSGVEWRLGWAPIGGYVKFAGDANAASMAPTAEDLAALRRDIVSEEGVGAERKYFHFKPLWQRTLIILAGPGANFVLAILLFAALSMAFGETAPSARIAAVLPQSPAAAAGFRPGDLVTRVDGRPVADFSELTTFCALRAGEAIRFEVSRGGRPVEITATPIRKARTNPVTGEISKLGYLGVAASGAPANLIHRRYGPIDALARGAERSWDQIATTVFYLSRIVRGAESGDQLRSFLGIARASGDFAKEGAYGAPTLQAKALGVAFAMATLIAALSVNIGFANLLPIPVLDGGHLLFYAYEAAARRPLDARVQAAGYRVGLALLLCLMLFATWNDLQQPHILKFLGGLLS